jgi:putative transposase
MASPEPLQPGQIYHIYNRGNNRENLFVEERNYRYFLTLYSRHVAPVVDTYAYCLLRNHFHLLVRIRDSTDHEANQRLPVRRPSQAFSNLFNAYAKAFNRAYGRTGTLFQRPFGRIRVQSDAHFAVLVAYIHRNPVHHGFVKDLEDWPFSSHRAILSDHPTAVARESVLDWFDGQEGFRTAHQVAVDEHAITPLVIEDCGLD